jgi:hypothetical protein
MATINTILGTHTLKDSRSIINANFSAINDQIEDIIELEGIPGPEGPEGPEGPMGTGIVWRGAWSNATSYNQYDAVVYEGQSYVAILANSATTPGTDPTKWEIFAAKGDSTSGFSSGTKAGRPAFGATGTLYAATDEGLLYEDTGTSWRPYYLPRAGNQPLANTFSGLNEGTSTLTDQAGGLAASFQGASNGFRGYIMAAPAAPFTVCMKMTSFSRAGYERMGMLAYNSGNGRIFTNGRRADGSYRVEAERWNSTTSWSGSVGVSGGTAHGPFWVKMVISSTQIINSVSLDGGMFYEYYTETISSHMSAVTHIGFGGWDNTNTAWVAHVHAWAIS